MLIYLHFSKTSLDHPRLPRCDPLRQTSFIAMNVGYGMQCAWVTEDALDEPLDVHLCSYFHEQHRVTRRHT